MKNSIVFAITLCLALVPGCSDDFLDISDPNSLVADEVYTDYQTSILAINGAYAPLKEVDLWGDQIHFFLHQITNEYGLLWQGDAGWNQMKDFSQQPNNQTLDAVWGGLAKVILRSNEAIQALEGFAGTEAFTPEQRNGLLGQAYFLRGYAFFLGVRTFGEQPVSVDGSVRGFPLILSPPTERDATLVPRATVDEVYAQIIMDLEKRRNPSSCFMDRWRLRPCHQRCSLGLPG